MVQVLADRVLVEQANTLPENARGRMVKYIIIRDWIADRIASGEFASGAQLPSEHDIMELFQVSRVTVRQAFDQLRALGMIEARRGKGYFVNRLLATAQLERLQSFGEMMAPLGVPTHSDVINLREIIPDAATARELRVDPAASVLRMVRARIAGGTTVSLDESYLPLSIGRKLMLLDLARQDAFVLMEKRLGIEIGYADLTFSVAAVPPTMAPLLPIAPDELVIRLKRLTFDSAGQPIMFEHIYARIDMLQFRVRTPRW